MKTKILTCLGIFVAVIVFGIYWLFVGEMKFFNFSHEDSRWANFGSYAGGIFAALAFLVVVYQNYERDKEQRKQDFERTFFMMLEHHNTKLRELEKPYLNKEYSTIDYIYSKVTSKNKFCSIREIFIRNDRIYSEIDSYFLNLYRILKFIYKNKEFNNSNEYSSLLRSFLSRKVLLILAYHLCDREKQYDEYIKYVNHFSFLEHLSLHDLEFRFISYLTGFNKDELYNNFRDFVLNREDFYYSDENSYPYHRWKEYQGDVKSMAVIDTILNIFEKKSRNESIYKEDLIISDSYKKKLGLYDEFYDIYDKFYPLEDKKYLDNVLFHILYTFETKAFSTEQESTFGNMKIVYKEFIEYLRNK